MMNVNELESEIKKEKEDLVKLEAGYEKEEDGAKSQKLEYKISRKEETIDKMVDRQQALLDREAKDEEKKDPKDKNKEEEDKDICEECGGDLQLIGEDENGVEIFECVECHELYLNE